MDENKASMKIPRLNQRQPNWKKEKEIDIWDSLT